MKIYRLIIVPFCFLNATEHQDFTVLFKEHSAIARTVRGSVVHKDQQDYLLKITRTSSDLAKNFFGVHDYAMVNRPYSPFEGFNLTYFGACLLDKRAFEALVPAYERFINVNYNPGYIHTQRLARLSLLKAAHQAITTEAQQSGGISISWPTDKEDDFIIPEDSQENSFSESENEGVAEKPVLGDITTKVLASRSAKRPRVH